MCEFYCKCEMCRYDKRKCFCMGDGTPFCHMFKCLIPYCTDKDCDRECISYDELMEVYNG